MNKMYSLAQACAELHISTATGRNWLRLGKLKADHREKGRPLFSESSIASLKAELASGRGLKSRRNKRYVSGHGLYRSYVSAKSAAPDAVQEVLRLLSASDIEVTEGIVRLLLADAALQMLLQRSGQEVCHLPEWRGWEDTELWSPSGAAAAGETASVSAAEVGRSSCPEHTTDLLLRDLIGDSEFGQLFVRQYPALFTVSYPWEPGEDALGLLYLSCRSLDTRKAAGAYFTPNRIVMQLIGHLRESDPALSRRIILDPCCGSGNFLLQLPADVPLARIYGCDVDPVSVSLARINLALRSPGADSRLLRSHILLADALQVENLPPADIILGNPPWGFAYSREQTGLLRQQYSSVTGKHADSGDLFLEKAVRSLPFSGRVSFLLPEAILNVKSHQPVREFLLPQVSLEYLDYLGEVFDGVNCPCILLQLQKNGQPAAGNGIQVSLPGGESFTIDDGRPLLPSGFTLSVPDREYGILKKLSGCPGVRFLNGSAVFALGIVTGDNRSYLSDSPGEGREAVLRGSDLFRYVCRSSGTFLRFAPDSFQQCAPEAVYRAEEKLLYRFICNQPVFAYDNRGILSLNSANILIPQLEGLSCKYVLAVLNSRMAQFFCEKSFRSVKLLRSHIEQIPIPAASEADQEEITELVDQLLAAGNPGQIPPEHQDRSSISEPDPQQSSASGEQVLRLYDRIDELVCRRYALPPEDYGVICRCTVPHFLPLSAPPSAR